MKRVYIATSFLIIAIGLCVFEQCTVESTYKTSVAYIEAASNSVKKADYESAAKFCKKLNDYWNKKYPRLSAMIEHGPLDETAITINSLPSLAESKNEELEKELVVAENQIKNIRDNQKITFGNIF